MKQTYFKKCIAIILCGCLCMGLCSCSLTDTSIDELMRPPQLSQSRQQVQSAINQLLGTAHQLIVPAGGAHRSSINLADLDGDQQNEAICLFTTGDTQLIEVLILQKSEEDWLEIGRYASDATAVDKVEFADLDQDGNKELLIGWSYLTGSDRIMEILHLGKPLRSDYKEKYTQFVIIEGSPDRAIVIDLGTASATLLGYKNKQALSRSSIPIDPRIASLSSLTVSATTAGAPAVYMDAQLQDQSWHTEILVISADEYLENKLFTDEGLGADRPYGVRCTDIDHDSIPEVPRTQMMENGDSSAYYTYWSKFDGVQLKEPVQTFTSTAEQFYLIWPKAWQGKVFVRQDSKMQRLYHFINRKDEILYSLRAFTVTEYQQVYPGEGWIALIESSEKVLAYKIGSAEAGALAFSTADWTDALHIY